MWKNLRTAASYQGCRRRSEVPKLPLDEGRAPALHVLRRRVQCVQFARVQLSQVSSGRSGRSLSSPSAIRLDDLAHGHLLVLETDTSPVSWKGMARHRDVERNIRQALETSGSRPPDTFLLIGRWKISAARQPQ